MVLRKSPMAFSKHRDARFARNYRRMASDNNAHNKLTETRQRVSSRLCSQEDRKPFSHLSLKVSRRETNEPGECKKTYPLVLTP